MCRDSLLVVASMSGGVEERAANPQEEVCEEKANARKEKIDAGDLIGCDGLVHFRCLITYHPMLL
jgi:hypothetical protein